MRPVLFAKGLLHPLKWRRSRGFGVHSPFAFALIKSTIYEDGDYGRYAQLREVKGADFATLALIFRLVCRFQPKEVTVKSKNEAFRRAVSVADSRCRFSSALSADFVIVENATDFDARSMKEENVVFFADLSGDDINLWNRVTSSMSCGMTFRFGRYGLAVRHAALPRQHFELLY